jgi:hypothetical protein
MNKHLVASIISSMWRSLANLAKKFFAHKSHSIEQQGNMNNANNINNVIGDNNISINNLVLPDAKFKKSRDLGQSALEGTVSVGYVIAQNPKHAAHNRPWEGNFHLDFSWEEIFVKFASKSSSISTGIQESRLLELLHDEIKARHPGGLSQDRVMICQESAQEMRDHFGVYRHFDFTANAANPFSRYVWKLTDKGSDLLVSLREGQ